VLVYYVDIDNTKFELEKIPGDNGNPDVYGAEIKLKKGASAPNYNWRKDAYTQQMTNMVLVMFTSEADGKAFFEKLALKKKNAKAPAKRIVLKSMEKKKK
jgi:hypothetical protein